MVEYSGDQLDSVFAALSDSTRRSILKHLQDGPATVSELARPHEMTFQGVSKHLKKLEAAGLVRRRKEGREVWCELVVEPMQQASFWIEQQRHFWEVRLDRLGGLLSDAGSLKGDPARREAMSRRGGEAPDDEAASTPDDGAAPTSNDNSASKSDDDAASESDNDAVSTADDEPA